MRKRSTTSSRRPAWLKSEAGALRRKSFLLVSILFAAGGISPGAGATRLKELIAIEGVRDNQLIGYGIVVGLAGTGDQSQTIFSVQTLTNILQKMGVSVASSGIRVRNTAAVMLTATLPPFAQPGTRIDVTAAAAGDAANLQGGLLVLTPLKGPDGQVYATAQGPVVTGGFGAGKTGTTKTVNHPTVGRVPEGAIVERPSPSQAPGPHLRLQLLHADFTTAARIADAINGKFPERDKPVAHAENSALVTADAPKNYSGREVVFLSELESLEVEADRPAKVVINERTGTIVMGKEVHIAPVAILHGNLTVEVQTNLVVSQPPLLPGGAAALTPQAGAIGKTVVTPQVEVIAKEEKARNLVLKQGATVEELVRGLMSIGSTPRDVIAILQNLLAAGALEAELEVI
jgi:flagellar P-ring protein precursor FlgI